MPSIDAFKNVKFPILTKAKPNVKLSFLYIDSYLISLVFKCLRIKELIIDDTSACASISCSKLLFPVSMPLAEEVDLRLRQYLAILLLSQDHDVIVSTLRARSIRIRG